MKKKPEPAKVPKVPKEFDHKAKVRGVIYSLNAARVEFPEVDVVEFTLKSGEVFQVSLHQHPETPGTIDIRSTTGVLVVGPIASNAIDLGVVRR